MTLDPKALEAAFDKWWSEDGQYLDPDTSDVPWFDKRRGLAAYAYAAALAALPQAEPVAWLCIAADGSGRDVPLHADSKSHYEMLGREIVPLFASPTPAVSREVTEEMVEAARRVYESASRHNPEVSISERIRAAFTAALSQPHSEK